MISELVTLAIKCYELNPDLRVRVQFVKDLGATARTLNCTSYYKILLNKNASITVEVFVHELAHVVAWERPDLGAKGHNTEYMNILYTLYQEAQEDNTHGDASLKSVVAL